MYSHYSAGSAESTWGSNGPGCESLDSAKPTVRPGLCFNAIGRMCLAIPTSPDSTGNGLKAMAFNWQTGTDQVQASTEVSPSLHKGQTPAAMKFYDPSRTLMPDGGIMENWKEQEVANALSTTSGGGTKAPAVVVKPKKYMPLRKLTEAQVMEAIEMYQSGLSLAKCAEPFGVSRQSMHDLLKRRIKLRDRLEAIPRLTDEERSKVQEKRNRALKRYRTRAKRVTKKQLDAVKERDKVCVKCSAPGVDVDHIVPVMKGGQTEMSNLQFLCKECHIEKSRADWKGVSRKEATQSTSFAEASRSHAKTSPLRENEKDLTVKDQDCSTKQPESLTLFSGTEDGSSLRMFPDSFRPTEAVISESFSRRWPNSGFTISPTEFWTADTSECPNGGGVFSSLPDVLEVTVPSRFFLSPKAAAGILRRAGKRGKDLPEPLDRALRALSEEETGATNLTATERMSREAA